jgi:hypothetical protein
MHVHPVLPWNLKLQQPQLPRSEPDEQPNESSQLAIFFTLTRAREPRAARPIPPAAEPPELPGRLRQQPINKSARFHPLSPLHARASRAPNPPPPTARNQPPELPGRSQLQPIAALRCRFTQQRSLHHRFQRRVDRSGPTGLARGLKETGTATLEQHAPLEES